MKRLIAKILAVNVASMFTSNAFAAGADKSVVPNKIELKATPFTLADVQLLDGPFNDASGRKTMVDLIPIVHVSRTTSRLDHATLEQIVVLSHATNTRLGVTGVLVIQRTSLMQLLEGDAPTLHPLFEKSAATHAIRMSRAC